MEAYFLERLFITKIVMRLSCTKLVMLSGIVTLENAKVHNRRYILDQIIT